MKKSHWNHLTRSIAGVLFLSISTAVLAQYVWLNENGSKQYSDMAPPTSVPKERILKSPGQAPRNSPAAESKADTDENTSGSALNTKKEKQPMTLAEKNTDFQKRKIEQAEKEKKAAEEAKRLADKAKNCDLARQYQRTLDEGIRIARTEKNGERSFLSDEQRNQEIKDNKETLGGCK